jgi:hypothetical protein
MWYTAGSTERDTAMRKHDKSYRFRLPNELFEAARQKAQREDLSLAQVLRRFIRAWVTGEIEMPPHTEFEVGTLEDE